MFFFNTVARPAMYGNPVRGEGLDDCYDCCAEVDILHRYLSCEHCPFALKKESGESEEEFQKRLNSKIAELSSNISKSLSQIRTLASPNTDPEKRIQALNARQRIGGLPAYQVAESALDFSNAQRDGLFFIVICA